jgi:hypothetical protein
LTSSVVTSLPISREMTVRATSMMVARAFDLVAAMWFSASESMAAICASVLSAPYWLQLQAVRASPRQRHWPGPAIREDQVVVVERSCRLELEFFR